MKLTPMYVVPYFRAVEYSHHMADCGWHCLCEHDGPEAHSQHTEACMVVLSGVINPMWEEHFLARENVHPLPHVLDSEEKVNEHHVKHLGHLGVKAGHNALQVRKIIRQKCNRNF